MACGKVRNGQVCGCYGKNTEREFFLGIIRPDRAVLVCYIERFYGEDAELLSRFNDDRGGRNSAACGAERIFGKCGRLLIGVYCLNFYPIKRFRYLLSGIVDVFCHQRGIQPVRLQTEAYSNRALHIAHRILERIGEGEDKLVRHIGIKAEF